MDLAARRVQVPGITPHPTAAFLQQCARQLTDPFDGLLPGKCYLIHERNTKFTQAFEALLKTSGVKPLLFISTGTHFAPIQVQPPQAADIRCQQVPHLPIYGGGGSPAAIAALAPVVDVYMLWGEPLKATAAFMEEVRAVACQR
jgi:hypothetical protein